jgi:hypothetical protein
MDIIIVLTSTTAKSAGIVDYEFSFVFSFGEKFQYFSHFSIKLNGAYW